MKKATDGEVGDSDAITGAVSRAPAARAFLPGEEDAGGAWAAALFLAGRLFLYKNKLLFLP